MPSMMEPQQNSSRATSSPAAGGAPPQDLGAGPSLDPDTTGLSPNAAAVAPMMAHWAEPGSTGKAANKIADLSKRATNPQMLRAMMAADPSLGAAIEGYFAEGNEDAALSTLLARAFPPGGKAAADKQKEKEQDPEKAAEKGGSAEKDPTDPTQALPAERTGDKALSKGQFKWTLKAVNHNSAHVDADFKPNKDKVDAKNVSFVQTVLNKVGTGYAYAGGTAAKPDRNKAKYEPFEESTTKKRVDHMPDTENDPFYGAEWDQANKKWKQESASWKLGSSTKGKSSSSASMTDTPSVGWAREGKGDTSTEFELVPVVLETREPLGALKWGFKIKDEANSPIELTGAQDKDCTDTTSDTWAATLDKFYDGKFETILDNFDSGKATLKDDHKTKLDDLAVKMKKNAALKAQLGGAADQTGDEAFNQKISQERAEAARDYLVSKGVDAGRMEIQSYGSDWARVAASKGQDEGKNRRVQIWLR